jgi:AbrB family looped-hinge helix DNA binding protein
VGPKGQVVLPKSLREQLGIQPGDEVDVELQDDALVVRRAPRAAYRSLRGMLRDPARPGAMLAQFEADRRADRVLEARRDARLDGSSA